MLIVTGAESPRETFNIIRRRMNMFKKVIAIMTATVLAASMLVACGGSTGASSSEPAAQEGAACVAPTHTDEPEQDGNSEGNKPEPKA
jgi:ABC-type oligopeptide transport system substrate-binding subunit